MFLRRNERFDPGSVAAGREVYSVEGDKLGTVSEISGSYLRVDAPWKRDYWLSAEYIDRTNGGVYMAFPKNQLDRYKLSEPGLEPEEDPMRDMSAGSAIISEEEQFEQRARMELELAQQREQLPPEHAAGTVGVPVEEELSVIEEKIGLPLDDLRTGAASPTGAIVAAPETETPAAGHARNSHGHATQGENGAFPGRSPFEDEDEPRHGIPVLWVSLGVVSVLALACAFVWRLRR